MRTRLPAYCGTCGAETACGDTCAECAADPRRGEFVETCTRLLVGEGDRDEQVEKARGLREAGHWSPVAVKWLLGAANRRAAEPLRQREVALAGHQHRGLTTTKKRRSL